MRALVVYESMFGNTRTIAQAVGDGLSSHLTVDLVEVGTAPPVLPDGETERARQWGHRLGTETAAAPHR